MTARSRTLLWLVFWATLLVAALLGLFVAWVLSEGLPPGTVITVDGNRFVVPALTETGHGLLLVLGVLVAALMIVLVVPLIVVLAIVVPVAAGSLGLLAGLLVLALALWPIVLLGRWWWKSRQRPATIAAP
jgi:protein-S-isoprenylcysteine O-methyltransferase Ste14